MWLIDSGRDAVLFKFNWFKLLLLVLVFGMMGLLAWTIDFQDWTDPQLITEFLEEWGALAPVFFMLLMAGAVVISPIPSVPLDAVAGAFFGPFLGTAYSLLGAEAGALISFFITRALGKEAVARWLKSDIGFCEKCSERNLLIVIFLARLLPVFSFDLVSYGAGLTRISPRGFAIATFLGMIPPTFAFNYFGSGIFSGSGYTIFLAGLIMVLALLAPRWLKLYNPWGLYSRLEKHMQ